MNHSKERSFTIEGTTRKYLESQLSKIVKGAGISFSGRFLGTGIYYVTHIMIARLVGVELFGLYVLGLTIFSFAENVSRMGLHEGALRYISMYLGKGEENKIKGTIIQSISLSFVFGVVVGSILFFQSNFIADRIFHKPALSGVIKIFSIGVPFMASMMVASFATRGFQKMQYFVYVKNLFHPIANLVLVTLFCWFGLGIYGATYAWVISGVLGLVLAFYFIKKEFPQFTTLESDFNARKLLRFSAPLVLVGVLQFLIMWIDTFMLGYFRPASDVGIYRAAVQTALLVTLILSAFSSILAPIISDLYSRRKLDELNEIFQTVTRWLFYFSFPVFIFVTLSASNILRIFGPTFKIAWLPLVVLAFAQLINCSVGAVGYMLIMSGNQNIEFWNTLGVSITNIFLNFLFIPILGMLGAALATGISLILLNLVRLMEVRFVLHLWPYNRKYMKGLFAGIVAGTVAFFFGKFIPNYHYLFSIFTSATLVGVVFISVIFSLKLDEEDQAVLSAAKAKILGGIK